MPANLTAHAYGFLARTTVHPRRARRENAWQMWRPFSAYLYARETLAKVSSSKLFQLLLWATSCLFCAATPRRFSLSGDAILAAASDIIKYLP